MHVIECNTFKVPLSAIFFISSPPQKAPVGTYKPWGPSSAFFLNLVSKSSFARAVGEPIYNEINIMIEIHKDKN